MSESASTAPCAADVKAQQPAAALAVGLLRRDAQALYRRYPPGRCGRRTGLLGYSSRSDIKSRLRGAKLRQGGYVAGRGCRRVPALDPTRCAAAGGR